MRLRAHLDEVIADEELLARVEQVADPPGDGAGGPAPILALPAPSADPDGAAPDLSAADDLPRPRWEPTPLANGTALSNGAELADLAAELATPPPASPDTLVVGDVAALSAALAIEANRMPAPMPNRAADPVAAALAEALAAVESMVAVPVDEVPAPARDEIAAPTLDDVPAPLVLDATTAPVDAPSTPFVPAADLAPAALAPDLVAPPVLPREIFAPVALPPDIPISPLGPGTTSATPDVAAALVAPLDVAAPPVVPPAVPAEVAVPAGAEDPLAPSLTAGPRTAAAVVLDGPGHPVHSARRRRRSASPLPPLPSPADIPEDAAGRVAIITVSAPPDVVPTLAAGPGALATRGLAAGAGTDAAAPLAAAEPDATERRLITAITGGGPMDGWIPVLGLGVALMVIFVLGVLVTR
ncbi:MAG TPA: hypothetical protein VGQ42_08755 [Candidatus Dormibacteraeota bacterium]|jgi:hypothetical protein|nr:hypothetical protein [Candidatus Dormibacteraeota bacterium]